MRLTSLLADLAASVAVFEPPPTAIVNEMSFADLLRDETVRDLPGDVEAPAFPTETASDCDRESEDGHPEPVTGQSWVAFEHRFFSAAGGDLPNGPPEPSLAQPYSPKIVTETTVEPGPAHSERPRHEEIEAPSIKAPYAVELPSHCQQSAYEPPTDQVLAVDPSRGSVIARVNKQVFHPTDVPQRGEEVSIDNSRRDSPTNRRLPVVALWMDDPPPDERSVDTQPARSEIPAWLTFDLPPSRQTNAPQSEVTREPAPVRQRDAPQPSLQSTGGRALQHPLRISPPWMPGNPAELDPAGPCTDIPVAAERASDRPKRPQPQSSTVLPSLVTPRNVHVAADRINIPVTEDSPGIVSCASHPSQQTTATPQLARLPQRDHAAVTMQPPEVFADVATHLAFAGRVEHVGTFPATSDSAPVRATEMPRSADPAPSVRVPIEAPELPQLPLRRLTVTVESVQGSERTDIQFVHRNGALDMAIRATNPEMARTLRSELPELVRNLEQQGFHSDLQSGERDRNGRSRQQYERTDDDD